MDDNNNDNNNNNDNKNTNINENNSEIANNIKKGKSFDKKEKSEDYLNKYLGKNNPISNNIYLIMICFIVILFILILFFFSSSYRTSRTNNRLRSYQKYQTLQNTASNSDLLINYHISSSINSCNVKNSNYDYINLEILKNILQAGARYIELSIFNSVLGDDNTKDKEKNLYPIVNNGKKKGEWKLCFNSETFENVCKLIDENAFSEYKKGDNKESSGVRTNEEPLFLSLNLKTNNNLYTLNRVARIFFKYFGNRLLPSKYCIKPSSITKFDICKDDSNNNELKKSKKDLLNITIKELKGKVVLFTSDGYEGSNLEEFINATWSDNINTDSILYRVYSKTLNENKDVQENIKNLIEKKSKFVIVSPDPTDDEEMSFFDNFKKRNYDTKLAFELGCQFIMVYFQSSDEFMDKYIEKFKDYSIIKFSN